MGRTKLAKAGSIISIILVIGLFLAPFIYVQASKAIYAHRVTKYLVEEQGYKPEEIQSVTGVWGVKLPPFFAVVVFQDEPFVEYIYFAHNKVIQADCRITEEGKKNGLTEAGLKHRDSQS
ncbi:DUF3139 domain-containing protein [Brevibacillus borstelensis]|uniref:DUF3139 domain-containing protein n=1 Tax=Brevibacillus borstelensis TaxID=45462 RepID=UPI0030C33451